MKCDLHELDIIKVKHDVSENVKKGMTGTIMHWN